MQVFASLYVLRWLLIYVSDDGRKGNYGILVECDAGYAAVALCTSGRNADCDGHYTDLKCCRETEEGPGEISGATQAQLKVMSLATRLSVVFSSHRLNAAAIVAAARTCNTLAGNHGVTLNCNDGFLVMGVCSSGTNGDCGGGAFTQIMCCDGEK